LGGGVVVCDAAGRGVKLVDDGGGEWSGSWWRRLWLIAVVMAGMWVRRRRE
jgi:hypothetical protein